jgi:hypothetical protein
LKQFIVSFGNHKIEVIGIYLFGYLYQLYDYQPDAPSSVAMIGGSLAVLMIAAGVACYVAYKISRDFVVFHKHVESKEPNVA